MTTSFVKLNSAVEQIAREVAPLLGGKLLPEPPWADARLQNLTSVIELNLPEFKGNSEQPRIALRVHDRDDMRIRIWGQWPKRNSTEYAPPESVKQQCQFVVNRLKGPLNIGWAIQKRLLPIYLPAFEEQLDRISEDRTLKDRKEAIGLRCAQAIGADCNAVEGTVNKVLGEMAIAAVVMKNGVMFYVECPDEMAVQLCKSMGDIARNERKTD